ncbi:MAG: gliding motility-associated C-terminal domain-containing protein [Saprospiraceae bacterium]|nr:gliding motility-associated C-terminal domain-containing protein [Lewinella sp.]
MKRNIPFICFILLNVFLCLEVSAFTAIRYSPLTRGPYPVRGEEAFFACDDLTVTETITDVTCRGGSDGAIGIALEYTGSGGTPSFVINWIERPEEGNTIEDLSVGTYRVQITMTVGGVTCTTSQISYTVDEPANGLEILPVGQNGGTSITDNNPCSPNNTGLIDLKVAGGAPSYTYSWSNNKTTQDIENLAAGDYSVTVTDGNGCTAEETFTVNDEESNLTVTKKKITDALCHNSSNGAIDINVNNGSGNYDYVWSNGKHTEDLSNLARGSYTVTVTDKNQVGCASKTFTVGAPDRLEHNVSLVQDIPCKDGGMGAVMVAPSGGTSPYTVDWQGGQTGTMAQYDTPGTYMVTVTDKHGCENDNGTISLALADPPQITDFPETALFSDNTPQNLAYEVDLSASKLNWKVKAGSLQNINTNATNYQDEGEREDNPLSLTFSLQDNRSNGTLKIMVSPQSGLCEGDPVETAIEVSSGACSVFVPDIFTPNGDNENDTWDVVFPSNDPKDYTLILYSRSGAKVFEGNVMTIRSFTAAGCPPTTYYYIVKDHVNGNDCRGAVSILR